ncbi:MAG: SoxR reducing system RseC family protein [Pseudomonadota bacterium]
MLEARGRVVAIEEGGVWVESVRQSACGACASKGHCGTALFGDALTGQGRFDRILARDDVGVGVGEDVIVGLPEEGMLRASLMLYGLPLLGLIGGMLLARRWGEGVTLLAGVLGLVASLMLMRTLARRLIGPQTQARILARVESTVAMPVSLCSRP